MTKEYKRLFFLFIYLFFFFLQCTTDDMFPSDSTGAHGQAQIRDSCLQPAAFGFVVFKVVKYTYYTMAHCVADCIASLFYFF